MDVMSKFLRRLDLRENNLLSNINVGPVPTYQYCHSSFRSKDELERELVQKYGSKLKQVTANK